MIWFLCYFFLLLIETYVSPSMTLLEIININRLSCLCFPPELVKKWTCVPIEPFSCCHLVSFYIGVCNLLLNEINFSYPLQNELNTSLIILLRSYTKSIQVNSHQTQIIIFLCQSLQFSILYKYVVNMKENRS